MNCCEKRRTIMVRIGDKVKYGSVNGEITNIVGDDMVEVRLEDGKEYLLSQDAITTDPENEPTIIDTIYASTLRNMRRFLKNMDFLGELAKELRICGVSELHIEDGEITSFKSKESYEEKLAKYRATALAEAERKAKEEFDNESK